MTTATRTSANNTSKTATMTQTGKTKKSKPAPVVTPEEVEAHIAAIESAEEVKPMPEPVKLGKKEMIVLEGIFEGIHAETGGDFCYFDSFGINNMTDKQLAGYISQLSQKGLINVTDDEFKQITLTELALVTVNLDFLNSFKHGFEAEPVPDQVKKSTGKDKKEPTDTRTILTGKGPRRIGQIVRRVFRSRHIKVAVTFDTTTHEYTVKVVEGNSLKFASIFETQFDVKGSRAQDYSYFTFTA